MKKKGFTLIELLAVIVILAIIALIITPLISDLIESSRYAAAVDSVLAYVAGANNQAASDVGIGGLEDFSLDLQEENELETGITDEELSKIKYKGKGPTYVYLLFSGESKYVSEGHFCMWGYSIDYNSDNGASRSDISYCGDTEPEGVPSCDILNNNSYDDNDVFKINNVEDLVCISELAKTKTFENKTIYLIKNVDFNSDSSYVDPNNKTYGDINGNGETEGLKTELTTGNGFYPIGSSSVPFKGIFEGYAKSISNLMINRSQDDVGLFGYNQGKIQGLVLNSTITGTNYVGGLVGYNDGGIINEIVYNGAVSGTCHIGGIVGVSKSGEIKSVLVKDVILSGSQRLGGISGNVASPNPTITGVVEKVSLPEVCSYSGKVVGNMSAGNYDVYASNLVTGKVHQSYNGTEYIFTDEMLNVYDKVLDTYIGGDTDESGYYFDYENETSSNIVLKSTAKNPIKFTLKGKGTESDPYIIDSVQRYKEASTLAGSENSYKLKITENLDFADRHYYALGTNGNLLSSDIDGDMHTLSNISFGCAENCGLIFQNSKTIEGLNISNVTLTSNSETMGGVVGRNTGTVKGINAVGINLTANSNVGCIVGYNENGTVKEVTTDGNINGFSIGGVVGQTDGGEIISTLTKNVTLTTTRSAGGIFGRLTASNIPTVIGVVEKAALPMVGYSFGKIAGTTTGSYTGYASSLVTGNTHGEGIDGTRYTLIPPTTVSVSGSEIDSLTYYDNVGVLDTVIGGDNDNSGYYLQYNDSADSIIVVKAGTSGGVVNPGGEVNPSSPVPIIGESVGTNPPTCVLNEVIPRSNGIQAVLTCEDEEGAPTIRSQWNVNKNAVTNQFSDIGIIKNGSVNGNSKTVRPYWSTSDPISVPHRGDCYYYRFGAMDASGNYSYYVTENCYHAFTD